MAAAPLPKCATQIVSHIAENEPESIPEGFPHRGWFGLGARPRRFDAICSRSRPHDWCACMRNGRRPSRVEAEEEGVYRMTPLRRCHAASDPTTHGYDVHPPRSAT